MNSSDDSIDKPLRDHFQRIFDDFEVQPAASLKTHIWQRINVPTKKRRPYGVLLLGVLLLIGTGLYLRSYHALVRAHQTNSSQPTVVAQLKPDQSGQSRKERETGPFYSHHFTHTTSPSSAPVVQPTINPQTKETHLLANRSDRPVNVAGSKPELAQQKAQEVNRKLINNRRSTRTNQASLQSLASFDKGIVQSDNLVSRQRTKRSETPEILLTTDSNSPAQPLKSVEGEAVSWESLRSLALRPIGRAMPQISRNVQLPSSTSSSSEPAKSRRKSVRWLLGVSPLSTYQLMTVVAKPDAYVQRVGAPSAFSGSTWGYQLSGGAEWHQFDFQLSVGQIRRWAYYDLATDAFQVKPVGGKKYQVTSLDESVAENVSLTTFGAGISKQYVLGGAHSRYFTRLGGQASYVPASGQTLIWAKAALGVTLPLQKGYQLQVGPTVEYGFSRLWSNERQLIIHPYLVGAAITIRPTKP